MAKKIILISSGPLFIILAVLVLIFIGIGRGQAQQQMSIDMARTQIIELADAGKLTEVDTAIDKIITDYKDDSALRSNLFIIADSFVWRRLYDRSEYLYRLVIDKSADTSLSTKARLGLSRADVLNLIGQKKYSAAREQINSMVVDFRDEPDLATALFQIGQEFTWQRRYTESKDAFDSLISGFSNSSLAQQSKLWSARINICALINGGKALSTSLGQAKNEDITVAIDKLINDFEGDSGLADALFWIGREYEWSKGTSDDRTDWYDAPNSIYQRLVSQFKYGQAEWDYKRLSHRMKIFNLLKGNDQNAIDTTIENLVKEFAGRPELPGELYWIACGYEEDPNKGAQAKQMYERIIKEYPDSDESKNSILNSDRLDIWETIKTGDINKAQILTDGFIAKFNQNPYSGECLSRVALNYYKSATDLKKQMHAEEAKDYFAKAENIWQQIINELPCNFGESYYAVACCRQNQKNWAGAIEYYQKVVDEWPNYKWTCGAQAAVGWCYEAMMDSNQAPKAIVNPITEQAYTTVINKYPDSYISHYAAYRLAEMSNEKGDKANAIVYYRMFLALAGPENNRIDEVKTKLAGLEGVNK